MTNNLASRAGKAVTWKGIQLVSTRLISFVRLLVLARLLVPEDFGLLAIGLTAVQTITVVTDFGMIPALIQHPKPSSHHFDAAWTVGISRAFLITVGIILAAPLIALLYGESDAIPIIRVLALLPLFEALASIKIAQLTRRLQFRSLAAVGVLKVIVETIVSILLATRLGVWAMVAGLLSGAIAYIIASYILAPYRPRISFDRDAARPLIHYGRWVFVTGIISVAGSSFLGVVISRQLGTESLGLYYLSLKLAFLFSDVAAEVIGAVAFPIYARLQDNMRQIARVFRAILTSMYAFLLPAYALLIALAPVLEEVVLGNKWTGTAQIVRILSVAGLIGLFGETTVPLLKGIGQPKKVAILELVQSFLLIAFSWPLARLFDLPGAAFAWIPAIVVSQFVSAWFIFRIVKRPFVGLSKPLAIILIVSILGAITAMTLTNIWPGAIGLIAANILSCALMGGGLLALDRLLHLGLINDLIRVFPQARRLERIVPVG